MTPEEQAEQSQRVIDNAKNLASETAVIQDAMISLGATITSAIEEALDSLSKGEDITKRIAKVYDRDITKSFNQYIRDQQKSIELQVKVGKGLDVESEVRKHLTKLDLDRIILNQQLESLSKQDISNNQELLATITAVKGKLVETSEEEARLSRLLTTQTEQREKNLGLTGKVASGLDGILKKIDKSGQLSKVFNIGGVIEQYSSLNNIAQQELNVQRDQNEQSKKLIGGETKRKNLQSAIKGELKLENVARTAGLALMNKVISLYKVYDERLSETRKTFGLSRDEAYEYNQTLADNLDIINSQGITWEGQTKSIAAINKSLGGIGIMLNGDMLRGASMLVTRLNLSEEAIGGIAKQSMIAGKSVEQLTKDQYNIVTGIESEYKVRLNVRNVVEEANKITGQTLINTMRLPGGITKAVAVAKSLGVEFEKINGMTRSLLDFESSITSELEAELLLGKDLNLERARTLALSGDQEGAMKELVAQAGSLEEIQGMNVLQQDALAKALGMSVDELSDMLVNQTSINTQLDETLNRKGDEVLENEKSLSIQKQLAESMENLNSILSSSLAIMTGMAIAAAILLAVPTGGMSLAGLGLLGVGAGVAGAAGGYATSKMVNDGVATSDNGPFTITDSYGATSMTAEGDSLAVSPNLSINPPQNTFSPNINIPPAPVQKQTQQKFDNEEGRETNKLLKMILQKQGNVNISGTKIGTAFSMNSYEIQ